MKKLLIIILLVSTLYSDNNIRIIGEEKNSNSDKIKNVNGAFGILLGDYGENYAIIKDKNTLNLSGGKKYIFSTFSLSSFRPHDKKIPKAVDGLSKYSVSSTHLTDRIYALYGKGRVFKKNEDACKYYTNLFEKVLDKKYGLTFQRDIKYDDNDFISYNLVATSNNVEIKISCYSILRNKENATLDISYTDKRLKDLNKQEFEDEKKRKKREKEKSFNNL